MTDLLHISIDQAAALLLVLLRVGGIFLAAPALAESVMPIRLRVLLAVVIALAVVGRVAQPAGPMGAAALLAAAGGELLIGAMIGLAARVILSGVEMGAFHISQQLGLSLGEVFDPSSGVGGDPVRRLFELLAVVVFLGVGGAGMVLSALIRTFQAVPLAAPAQPGGLLDLAVMLLGASLVLALKVAAPVLLAMLLATAALGMLQKTLPQCNILTVGLPARALLGLALMGLSLAGLGYLVEKAMEIAAAQLGAGVRVLT